VPVWNVAADDHSRFRLAVRESVGLGFEPMPAASDLQPRDVLDRIAALARFTGHGPGVTRLAYDEAWCAAHRWLADEARALGLAATPDWAGNLYLHPRDVGPGHEVLLVGSHLDSVKQGGRLDGAYGVVAGLHAALTDAASGGLPVVGFVTAEEEGSRFHGCLMGARSMLGRVDDRELDTVLDRAGITWRDALEDARTRGCAAPLPEAPFAPLFRPAMVLELHIEQGPGLEAAGVTLGIVERIAGFRHWTALVEGEARHAGTTPMPLRHDALAAAAEMIVAAEAAAREAGPPAVATVGWVRPTPGLFNVVPGTCELWLEVRHDSPGALDALGAEVTRRFWEIAQRRGVRLALEDAGELAPTPLSSPLVEAAEALAGERGIPFRRMASGAAHDTMVFAQAGVPALMIFVPSRGGISHSPDEATDDDDLVTGARFVVELAGRLAERHRP
jgi:allantoate deiminase